MAAAAVPEKRPPSAEGPSLVKQEGQAKPGKHNFLIKRVLFELDVRYMPLKAVGKGAFGVVCSAKDEVTGETVAIKKISNAFDSVVDARRALREIRLLRRLRHENIIQLKELMAPSRSSDYRDVYLVYELMDTDLHSIIRSTQPLSDDHVQYFIYQVLRGLKYIHSAKVLHRDLKPSNLLLKANCDLKICDFGLARTQRDSDSGGFMTDYVVTRWYRAPELLVSCDTYSSAIDVWSVGCILGELLGRKALWPGKTYIDQLQKILAVLGTPATADTEFIDSDKARAWIHAQAITKRVPWGQVYPGATPDAVDLITRMLHFNPARRISVDEALEHPYMAAYHEPPTEVVAQGPINCDFERQELTENQLRDLAFKEVIGFRAEQEGARSSAGGAAVPVELATHP